MFTKIDHTDNLVTLKGNKNEVLETAERMERDGFEIFDMYNVPQTTRKWEAEFIAIVERA